MRYRHTDSDYARDRAASSIFLSELKRQTKDIGNLTNLTAFRRIFGKNIETDLTNPPSASSRCSSWR